MTQRLPGRAREVLGEGPSQVSPMVALELAYLHEVGRARDSVSTMLGALKQSIGLEVADISLADLVEAAGSLSWTRDPFDRLIAAHAIVTGAQLVTADRTILENLPLATWD
jgi:PIN domain nuclease of toxin-antitoxin system